MTTNTIAPSDDSLDAAADDDTSLDSLIQDYSL